ncbi:MAG: hypothetical protein ACTHMS_22665 [Jatrophihabitans sp.]|uniref:hypothetical protein n=1 Tax=Jatrophihabitans sp. TaxID=1932789 RepID=UPI003F7D2828
MAAVDIGALLGAVEDASPVDAIDALSEALVVGVGARHVALLIANFSGDALVRMSHVSGTAMQRAGHNERAESVPLAGSPHQRVLLSQARDVVEADRGWLALVPITERGDAIGILEVTS